MNKNKLFELFEEAIETKNSEKINTATLGTLQVDNHKDFIPYLCKTLEFTWHFDHENIVLILQEFGEPESIDILLKTAIRKFEYLNYDDSKSLSRKCTWALADIGTEKAKEALIELTKNQDVEIAEFAKKRIINWKNELSRKKHNS